MNKIGRDKRYIEQLIEELHRVLHYNPDTGVFTWNIETKHHKAGSVAGSPHHTGYMRLYVFRRNFQDAILAHLYMTGEFKPFIGRIDRDYGNCKFNNIYVSDKKIIAAGKRPRVTKIEIMAALDGSTGTIGKLSVKFNKPGEGIKEQLDELLTDRYIMRNDLKVYSITAVGHKEIISNGSFERRVSAHNQSYDFQMALPGTLTAGRPQDMNAIMRKKKVA